MNRDRSYLAAGAAAIIIFGLAVFWPLLNGPFLFDDLHTVRDNPAVREHLSPLYFLTHPESASQVPGGAMVRPLLTFSYALDHHLAGPKPFRFRLTNLILHLINAMLIMALTRQTPRLRNLAPWAGLLFLVLPLHSIMVGYVSCRSTLLSGFFYLAALTVFARALNQAPYTGKLPIVNVAVITFLFALGILAKSVTATLPAAIILWALAFVGTEETPKVKPDQLRFTVASALYVLAAFALYLILRRFSEASTLFPAARPWPVWQYAAAQVPVFWTYLRLMALPVNLSLEHQAWVPASPADLMSLSFVLATVGLTALLAGALALRRRAPEAAFAMAFAVVYLLPTSSVVPLVVVINENRPYLAALILVWPVLLLFQAAASKRPWTSRAVLASVIGLLAVLTIDRGPSFQNETSAWTEAVRNAPQLARPYVNLGLAQAAYGRSDQARRWYDLALQIDPCSPTALTNLANLDQGRGDWDRAVVLYNKALECDPWHAAAMINLANLLAARGEQAQAAEIMERARSIWPDHPFFASRAQ